MRVGLDFDNTIVMYEGAIDSLASELLDIPHSIKRTKVDLRNYLRENGRESEWTAFQGELYGPGMEKARPFEGALEAINSICAMGCEAVIISHRSRYPYGGRPHDLHVAANKWVDRWLQQPGKYPFASKNWESKESITFLETKEEKLSKIRNISPDLFLDDLPDILLSPLFPSEKTQQILFDPYNQHLENNSYRRVSSWLEFCEYIASKIGKA